MASFDETQMSQKDVSTVLKNLYTKLQEKVCQTYSIEIDDGLVLVTCGNFCVILFPPKGYTSGSDLIGKGWICLQDIYKGGVSVLQNTPLIRGITVQNQEQIISEIGRLCK